MAARRLASVRENLALELVVGDIMTALRDAHRHALRRLIGAGEADVTQHDDVAASSGFFQERDLVAHRIGEDRLEDETLPTPDQRPSQGIRQTRRLVRSDAELGGQHIGVHESQPGRGQVRMEEVVFPAPFGPAIATRIGRRSNSANSIRGMGLPGIPGRRIAPGFACHRHRRGPAAPASRERADSGETAATPGIPRPAGVPRPNPPRPGTRKAGRPRRPAAGRAPGAFKQRLDRPAELRPELDLTCDRRRRSPRSAGHRG